MMPELHKFPRTPHIEGSRLQPGDEDLESVPFRKLTGRRLVVTEKVDGANAGISFDDLGEVHVTSPADELFRIDSLNGEVYEAGVLAGDAVAQPHPDVRQSYRVTKDDPLDLRDADGDPFQITVDQDEVIVTLESQLAALKKCEDHPDGVRGEDVRRVEEQGDASIDRQPRGDAPPHPFRER